MVTCATLVSAISYVKTPQTPLPLVWTSSMMRVAVGRFRAEELFQHIDDKLHWSVIVVQQDDLDTAAAV